MRLVKTSVSLNFTTSLNPAIHLSETIFAPHINPRTKCLLNNILDLEDSPSTSEIQKRAPHDSKNEVANHLLEREEKIKKINQFVSQIPS